MNDLQKDKLNVLLNDELLVATIRQVMHDTVEEFKPKPNDTDGDDVLGQKYRAYETSRSIIEKSFINLSSYRKTNKNKGAGRREV